jgi:hypothetical protein
MEEIKNLKTLEIILIMGRVFLSLLLYLEKKKQNGFEFLFYFILWKMIFSKNFLMRE